MNYSFIFDIGGVLVDFDLGIAIRRLEKFSPFGGEEIRGKIFDQNVDGRNLFIDYETGVVGSSEFFEQVRKRTRLDMDYEDFARDWSDIFTENMKISHFLELIKDDSKVIVSNISPLHWEGVSKYHNINNFFTEDEIIKSYEVGFRKPDLRMYEMAKKILPADTEIIYFDDSEKNVDVASELGIRGIKYDCRDSDIDKIAKKLIYLKK
ncbi:MAG: HAD family hydrolase [Candidatus Paceibacterota bacterium]